MTDITHVSLNCWKTVKQFESLIGVVWFFQDLSHPLLAKAIQGLSVCFNKYDCFSDFHIIQVLFRVINKSLLLVVGIF